LRSAVASLASQEMPGDVDCRDYNSVVLLEGEMSARRAAHVPIVQHVDKVSAWPRPSDDLSRLGIVSRQTIRLGVVMAFIQL
jgi:hypothetical protein